MYSFNTNLLSLAWTTCCHSSGGSAAGADRYRHTPRERGRCWGTHWCSGKFRIYISLWWYWWSSTLWSQYLTFWALASKPRRGHWLTVFMNQKQGFRCLSSTERCADILSCCLFGPQALTMMLLQTSICLHLMYCLILLLCNPFFHLQKRLLTDY